MLLNSTINAVFANATAVAANVIASVLVGSASPAVFAEVPTQKRSKREMRWRYLSGQPGCDRQPCCGEHSEHGHSSLHRSLSSLLSITQRALSLGSALNVGTGCLTGTSGRS